MDEPLASLDEESRKEIIPFIRAAQEELAIPMVYVTHALPEVARLADRIALIDNGKIEAVGPTETILVDLTRKPAASDDAGAAFDAKVATHHADDGLTELAFDGGRLLIPRIGRASGERVRVRIVATDVSLSLDPPSRSSILNVFAGVVVGFAPRGETQMLVSVKVGGVTILSRITKRSAVDLGLSPGMKVWAQFKGAALIV